MLFPLSLIFALFLLIFTLRKLHDRHVRIQNHRAWCKQHLTNTRRTISELIDNRPPSHHIS